MALGVAPDGRAFTFYLPDVVDPRGRTCQSPGGRDGEDVLVAPAHIFMQMIWSSGRPGAIFMHMGQGMAGPLARG